MFTSSAVHAWYQKGSITPLNGHQIFFIDEGSADQETLLLIHGFPTSSYDFKGIWPRLAKHYRIVCIDMLGFGFSDKPNHRRYTIHSQVDLVEALIRKLKLTNFHILAHDYAVSVAQELLARKLETSSPHRAQSCCFLNGGLFPETHRSLPTQKLLLGPFGKLITKLYSSKKNFSRSFSSVFGGDTQPSNKEIDEFWEIINHNDGRHLFHNLMTYILDRRDYRSRWLNALQTSDIALSLINGSVDPVSGQHMVERYQQLGCRLDHLCELSAVGHYPHVEAPIEVAKAYLNFIRDL